MAVVLIVEDDLLTVEDDLLTLEVAALTIREWGHQTLVAGDVDEALSILRSPQHIDVLFTDIYLKEAVWGGCELARQAIGLRPKLRVLYTTGNSVTRVLQAQFVEGTHCLRKPYTDFQFHDSLDALVAA